MFNMKQGMVSIYFFRSFYTHDTAQNNFTQTSKIIFFCVGIKNDLK